MNPLQTIPNLPPAISLDGSEQVWINQAGVDRRATAAALAQAAALTGYVPVTGGTITGDLTVLGVFTGGGHIYAATPPPSDNSTKVATTAWVDEAVATALEGYLPLTGGTLTGSLLIEGTNTATGFGYALTPVAGDDSTKLATTAFVTAAIAAGGGGGGPTYLPLTGGTLTGPLAINVPGSTYLALNDAAGNVRRVLYETAGTARWGVAVDNSAESGSNAGSNFVINRYADNGGFLDAAFTINRANGNAVLDANLTVGGFGYATTPAPGDNSNTLATTAFVDAAITAGATPGSNALPLMDGTAAAGVATAWSRGDHVHPSDTSRAAASALANYLPLSGGTVSGNFTVSGITALSGVSTAPTPAAADSSTNIATTAFVHSVVGSGAFLPLSGGTLTGNLNGPSATFTNSLTGGNIGSNGTLTVTGNSALNGTVSTGNLTSNNITSVNNLNCKDWVVCNDAPGNWRGLQIQSNGATRWLLIASSDAETGGNAGSTFDIYSYSDSGAGAVCMSINRASGQALFPYMATFQNQIVTNGFGNYGQVRMMSATDTSGYGVILRNDGSSFYILLTNQNDAYGQWNGYRPFSINVSNGAVSMSNGLTVNTLNCTSGGTISGSMTVNGGATINNGCYLSAGGTVNGNLVCQSFPGSSGNYFISGYFNSGNWWNAERMGVSVGTNPYVFVWYNNGTQQANIVSTSSDRRLKSDIRSAGDALGIVNRVAVYDLNYDAGIKSTVEDMPDSEPERWPFSLIADEVAAELPFAGIRGLEEDRDHWVAYNHQHMISVLWKAVQQLTERLEALEAA